jgi:hypothetical protein
MSRGISRGRQPDISLRQQVLSRAAFQVRDYQHQAAEAFRYTDFAQLSCASRLLIKHLDDHPEHGRVRKPLILQERLSEHSPHNAGVEGSSPSLSTNKINPLCAISQHL